MAPLLLLAALAQADDPPLRDCSGPAPGAAAWFTGDFTLTDGVVRGTERWVLRPNERWAALGATACEITWTVTGSATSPGTCPGCALSLRIHAEPDRAGSDCPRELVIGRPSPNGVRVGGEAVPFDVVYDVRLAEDGTATLSFQSGTQLGVGRLTDGQLRFTSPRQCKWF